MRGWLVYLILGVILDVVGATLFVAQFVIPHFNHMIGVVGMMVFMVGVVFTRSGVLLMRKARTAANAA